MLPVSSSCGSPRRADAEKHDIRWARGSGGRPCLSSEQPAQRSGPDGSLVPAAAADGRLQDGARRKSLFTKLLAPRLDASKARGVRSTVNGVVAVRCA